MRQISGGDAFYLFTDKESRHQHISALFIYDTTTVKEQPLRFKTIMKAIEERLGSSPIFRQRLVTVPFNLDYPYWINDPDFDLEYHVRHIALPKPGDWRQLCILASRIHARPLDMTRPLWEAYIIEGLDNVDFLPEGSFAMLLKIHHVASDGVAAAELTMGLHDLEPYPSTPRRQPRWRPGQVPGPATLLTRATVNNTRAAIKTVRTLSKSLGRSLSSTWSDETKAKEQPAGPLTRFNDTISPHRTWDAVRFSLDEFKQVKDSVPGATINDVVLTVCGGAMTRYLEQLREAPSSDLSALVPISVRQASEQGQAGNKVHLTRASLCTTEQDPLARLKRVRDTMTSVKEINAVSAREMVEVQEQLPAPTLLMAGRAVSAGRGPGKAYRQSHNTVVTNVPGPQQPLYFCGAKLAMFTGMAVVTDHLGLSHAVTSYDGTLVIAPLADRKMLPDPALYADCIRQEFDALKARAVSEEKPATTGRKRTVSSGKSSEKPAPKRKTQSRKTKRAENDSNAAANLSAGAGAGKATAKKATQPNRKAAPKASITQPANAATRTQ